MKTFQRTVGVYRGKRRNEVPPHIFAIAEGSYHSMCLKVKNQSILSESIITTHETFVLNNRFKSLVKINLILIGINL